MYCTMKNIKIQDMLTSLIVQHMDQEQWLPTKENLNAETNGKGDIRSVSAAS